MRRYLLVLICVGLNMMSYAQKWDDMTNKVWPSNCNDVEVKSSADNSVQHAMFFRSQSCTPKPLIVSLHTWSGDYRQADPLIKEIIEKGYNYIHPNFRGPNKRPQACCSSLAIADVADAIEYALANADVDPQQVHVIGCSGGGYMSLMLYMCLKYPVKSFSAWVPVSDLESWYWECVGRNSGYAKHIMLATSSESALNVEQAVARSPIACPFPEFRKNTPLFIYAGVHDGYNGSVPITQSINMYNHLASILMPQSKDVIVADSEIIDLLTKRSLPGIPHGVIGDRKSHLVRKCKNIELTIFEGGHEQLDNALELIPINK